MNIAVFAPFPEKKHGIARVSEELLKKFCNLSEIENISIITPYGQNLIDPSILKNKNVFVYSLATITKPIGLFKIAKLLKENFLRLIKVYKQNDVFLLLSMPAGRFFFQMPIGGLYFIFLMCKFGVLPRNKFVQVIYDFIPYIFPDDDSGGAKTVKIFDSFKKYFREVPVKYIAISHSTKEDAIKFWNLQSDKISVVHLGSFLAFGSPRQNFGNNKILTVADIAPRKNHVRLLKAFEILTKINPYAELIIAGMPRKHAAEVEALYTDIKQRNEGIKITLRSYVTDDGLTSLYRSADVFVYPSLYEGFGLPVLEAMASGCPVIASKVSSLPEIVGDAGILIDPNNVEEIAQVILRVLSDNNLAMEMSKRGIQQAKEFSWDKTAENFLKIFRDVLSIN